MRIAYETSEGNHFTILRDSFLWLLNDSRLRRVLDESRGKPLDPKNKKKTTRKSDRERERELPVGVRVFHLDHEHDHGRDQQHGDGGQHGHDDQIGVQLGTDPGIARPDDHGPPGGVSARMQRGELEKAQLALVEVPFVQPSFQTRQMDVADRACAREQSPLRRRRRFARGTRARDDDDDDGFAVFGRAPCALFARKRAQTDV